MLGHLPSHLIQPMHLVESACSFFWVRIERMEVKQEFEWNEAQKIVISVDLVVAASKFN